MELPNIAAYAYQDVHVWSALLTCLPPPPLLGYHRGGGGGWMDGWMDGWEAFRGSHPDDTDSWL